MALQDNWLAWWNFDNNDGRDSSPANSPLIALTGTPFNGVAGKIASGCNISATSVAGIAAPNSNFSFPTGEMAISFWINISGISGTIAEGMMSKGVTATDREWFIGNGLNIRARFFTTNSSNYIGVVTNTAPLISGVWQHIVINKDNSNLSSGITIYWNGVLQTTNAEIAGVYTGMVSGNGRFSVGTAVGPSTQVSNGVYDLVGIRSQMLTPAEISQLYNGGAGYNPFATSPGKAMMNFF